MRIYLDVCCLHRPLDDQTQERIRIESEAVSVVLDLIARGVHRWVCSEIVEDETRRNPNEEHRSVVLAMLQLADEHLLLDEQTMVLAQSYAVQGVGAMDSLHLASAEVGNCDVLLTTDDDLIKKAPSLSPKPRVKVYNPARWLVETIYHDA